MSSTIAKRQDTVNTDDTRTAAGDALSAFAILVLRLSGRLAAAGDALARPAHQTSARWQVLAGAEDGDMTVADIARTLGQARQSVQRVADALEADGLIRYVDNPRHRRARLLALTVAGRRALTRIQSAQRVWANRLGAVLGERDLSRANRVLERALAVVETTGDRPVAPRPPSTTATSRAGRADRRRRGVQRVARSAPGVASPAGRAG